jgi:hypothetical protein
VVIGAYLLEQSVDRVMKGSFIGCMQFVLCYLLDELVEKTEKFGLVAGPILIETNDTLLEDVDESFNIVEVL